MTLNYIKEVFTTWRDLFATRGRASIKLFHSRFRNLSLNLILKTLDRPNFFHFKLFYLCRFKSDFSSTISLTNQNQKWVKPTPTCLPGRYDAHIRARDPDSQPHNFHLIGANKTMDSPLWAGTDAWSRIRTRKDKKVVTLRCRWVPSMSPSLPYDPTQQLSPLLICWFYGLGGLFPVIKHSTYCVCDCWEVCFFLFCS